METRNVDIKKLPPAVAELLEMVADGTEILIEDEGKSIARLTPIPQQSDRRNPGLHEGQGWVSNDFDALLPDEFWAGRV